MLSAVACLTLLHGRPPALSELGAVLGISKQAVFYRLHWLGKKGLWSRPTRAITPAGLRCARGWLLAGVHRALPSSAAPASRPSSR